MYAAGAFDGCTNERTPALRLRVVNTVSSGATGEHWIAIAYTVARTRQDVGSSSLIGSSNGSALQTVRVEFDLDECENMSDDELFPASLFCETHTAVDFVAAATSDHASEEEGDTSDDGSDDDLWEDVPGR